MLPNTAKSAQTVNKFHVKRKNFNYKATFLIVFVQIA